MGNPIYLIFLVNLAIFTCFLKNKNKKKKKKKQALSADSIACWIQGDTMSPKGADGITV